MSSRLSESEMSNGSRCVFSRLSHRWDGLADVSPRTRSTGRWCLLSLPNERVSLSSQQRWDLKVSLKCKKR